MKSTVRKVMRNRKADAGWQWPRHLFGGRVRTSTVVLIVAFLLAWWTYDTNRPEPKPAEVPQVVPPGYVPDPNYTWAPRTRLQPPVTSTEPRPPPTTSTTTTAPTATVTSPPTSQPGFPWPPRGPEPVPSPSGQTPPPPAVPTMPTPLLPTILPLPPPLP